MINEILSIIATVLLIMVIMYIVKTKLKWGIGE